MMMDFENTEAVIFDMDGTLIDSMWVWKEIDLEYLSRYDYEYTPEFHREIEGMNFYDTACYFKKKFNIQESVEEIMAEWHNMAEDKYAKDIKFKDGAVEFIKALKARGIKTGIATSNSRELTEIFLNANNGMELFNWIATSNEINASKPAPDIYLWVAKNLNVEPEKCLVFEDVPNGLLAGKNAGMKCCAIYDEYSKQYDEEKYDIADYYINAYNEIIL